MLKFFRKYNKWILAVGASLLMFAFLVQGTVSTLMPGPGSVEVGTLDGQAVKSIELRNSEVERDMLESFSPIMSYLTGEDSLHWLLLVHEARKMGLSASDPEVNEIVRRITGMPVDSVTATIAKRYDGASVGHVRQAVRHWLMVAQYRELILGLEHQPIEKRLSWLAEASRAAREARIERNIQKMQEAQALSRMASGAPRISEPALKHFVADNYATVDGKVATVDVNYILDQDPDAKPDPVLVQQLFDDHKDEFAGESEPFGFGYRLPDRVKLESLTVPFQAVLDTIEVDEAQAYELFQKNPMRFAGPESVGEDGQPKAPEYKAVRKQVRQTLRRELAQQQVLRIIKQAQRLLLAGERDLDSRAGYKVVPDGFEPAPMHQVAGQLREQFGITVIYRPDEDKWLTIDQANALPDIGGGRLRGQGGTPVRAYLQSALEFDPADDNPLVTLRLQEQIVSRPIESFSGSVSLIRLTDTSKAHEPGSVDEVREQVEQDALRLAAYRQLVEQKQAMVELAASQGIDDLAKQSDALVHDIGGVPRRMQFQAMLMTPFVQGVGRSEAFVDELFAKARSIVTAADGQTGKLDEVDLANRTGAVELPGQMAVAIYRIDEYQAISSQVYGRLAGSEYMLVQAGQSLVEDGTSVDPLSLDALKKRANWVDDETPEQPQTEDDQEVSES